MVTVIRCPACGALWEAPSPLEKPQLRCSACQTLFHFEKAESVVVDKAQLMASQAAHLAEVEKEKEKEVPPTVVVPEKKPDEKTPPVLDEAALTELAADVQDFEARTPEAPPKRSGFAALWTLLMLLAAGYVALVFFHKPLFEQVPALAPLYDTVCTRFVPCQNFVRRQSAQIAATVRVKSTGDVDVNGEVRYHPVLEATIQNQDTYPEHFPAMNLALLDAAGSIVAQRVLEPRDYGVTANQVLPPLGTINATIYITDDLPVPVTEATLTPLTD